LRLWMHLILLFA